MKKTLFSIFALLFIASYSIAQKKPKSPPMATESDMVLVEYSAPSMKGREIFGDLVPFGKVWRTGADNATKVTFKKDVDFGGASVKAGTYSMFTIPGEKEWTVVLNTVAKQWGAYNYDAKKNIAEIKVKSMAAENEMEMFTIKASDDQIMLAWDMTAVHIPLKF